MQLNMFDMELKGFPVAVLKVLCQCVFLACFFYLFVKLLALDLRFYTVHGSLISWFLLLPRSQKFEFLKLNKHWVKQPPEKMV